MPQRKQPRTSAARPVRDMRCRDIRPSTLETPTKGVEAKSRHSGTRRGQGGLVEGGLVAGVGLASTRGHNNAGHKRRRTSRRLPEWCMAWKHTSQKSSSQFVQETLAGWSSHSQHMPSGTRPLVVGCAHTSKDGQTGIHTRTRAHAHPRAHTPTANQTIHACIGLGRRVDASKACGNRVGAGTGVQAPTHEWGPSCTMNAEPPEEVGGALAQCQKSASTRRTRTHSIHKIITQAGKKRAVGAGAPATTDRRCGLNESVELGTMRS